MIGYGISDKNMKIYSPEMINPKSTIEKQKCFPVLIAFA